MKRITISMTVKEAQQLAYALIMIAHENPDARNKNCCIKFSDKLYDEVSKATNAHNFKLVERV